MHSLIDEDDTFKNPEVLSLPNSEITDYLACKLITINNGIFQDRDQELVDFLQCHISTNRKQRLLTKRKNETQAEELQMQILEKLPLLQSMDLSRRHRVVQ